MRRKAYSEPQITSFIIPTRLQITLLFKEFKKAYNRYPKMGALYAYVTAQYIEAGFKKAGKIDKEKLIDAIEGISIDSPVGKLEIRKCDHQLTLPMYFGVTKKDRNMVIS